MAFLAVALAVAGCGGADTSDAPPEEAERTEGAEEVAPERSAGTTAETTRLEETYPREVTAQYGGSELSPDDQAALNLLACQTAEVKKDLGREGAEALLARLLDESGASQDTGEPTDVQTLLAERGYDCNGRAVEVLGRP